LSQLSHERAWVMGNDQLAASGLMVPCDIDVAHQNDGEAVARVADLDQRIARAVGADHAKTTHPLDFQPIENWKHLVASSAHECVGQI
jgi:hypothetical protein